MKSISYYTAEKKFIILPIPDKHQTCLHNFVCSETCLHFSILVLYQNSLLFTSYLFSYKNNQVFT